MDLSDITDIFLKTKNLKLPKDINRGNCYRWAYVAYMLYGGDLISVERFGAHAFIKIGNKYYDSESPQGVEDWKHLPFFTKPSAVDVSDKDAIQLPPEKFQTYWGFSQQEVVHIYDTLVYQNDSEINSARCA